MKKYITNRGDFYFYLQNDIIIVYNGEITNADSEFLCSFHKNYLDVIIAGFTSLKFKI